MPSIQPHFKEETTWADLFGFVFVIAVLVLAFVGVIALVSKSEPEGTPTGRKIRACTERWTDSKKVLTCKDYDEYIVEAK